MSTLKIWTIVGLRKLSYAKIKSEFIKYLSNKGKLSDKEMEKENIDLFSHFSDFRRYLFEENIADVSIFTKSLDDIKKMQIVGGKLTDTDDEQSESETQGSVNESIENNSDENSISEDKIDDSNDFLVGMLNDLLENESVINSLDGNENKSVDMSELTKFLSEAAENEEGEISFENLAESFESMYYLDSIYKDEESLKYLNSDNDEEISEEEKEKFKAYIKGDKDKISSEDLKQAYESIKNGTFDIDKYNEFSSYDTNNTNNNGNNDVVDYDDDIDNAVGNIEEGILENDIDDADIIDISNEIDSNIENDVEAEIIDDTKASSSTSSSGGDGGGGSYSSDDSTSTSTQSTKQLDPLDGKTSEELTILKNTKQGEIDASTKALQNVLSGKDQEKEKNCEDAKKSYLEQLEQDNAIDNELKEKEINILKSISDKEAEINKGLDSICQLNAFIISQEAIISYDEAKLTALNDALEALPKKGSSDYPQDSEQKSQIKKYEDELDVQIKQAQKNLDDDKKLLEEKNENGKSPKEELAYWEAQVPKMEEELKTLNEQKDSIEAEITNKCSNETKQAMKTYNDTKEEYTSAKEREIQTISTKLATQIADMEKITNKLNEVTAKEISSKYSLQSELFDKNIKLTSKYVKQDGLNPYLVIGPENPDPNVKYPVLVFLHGGCIDSDEQSLLETSFPNEILNNQDLANFNGYIIMPTIANGFWIDDDHKRIGMVCDALDDFTKTHNIDTNRISLAGHSNGGMSAEFFAVNFNKSSKNGRYHINKVAVMSGQSSKRIDIKNADVPMRGYYCSEDSHFMKETFKNLIGEENSFEVNTNHGDVPRYAYRIDNDGDGCSDLIQWLFA